jgi:alpha-glucosidase/alpha-D-xyloside xylohydrolase
MRFIHPVLVLWLSVATVSISAEPITAAGQAAQLDIRAAGEHSIRARQTGLPLMRAMWLHYPHDAAARALGTQYLWGRDLLIAPVFEKGATSRAVYLPAGTWYDWWTRATHAGGQTVNRAVDLATMPIFVRAGAILPLDPVRQYTSQVVREPTTLRVYRGADGQYTLYEDDGISQDYLSGKGTWTRMTWNERSARLTLEPGPPRGATNLTGPRTFTVELIPDGTTRTVPYSGRRVDVRF